MGRFFHDPLLKKHRDLIHADNCRVSEIFELMLLLCNVVLAIVGIFEEGYGAMAAIYPVYILLALGLYLFTRFYARRHLKVVPALVIIVLAASYSYAVLSGIVYNIHQPSVTVYSLMIAASSAYMLQIGYMLFIQLGYAIIYCALALSLKPEFGMQDVVNYAVFFVMAMLLAMIVYQNRLDYLHSLDVAVAKENETQRLLNDIPGGVAILSVQNGKAVPRYRNEAYYRMIADSQTDDAAREDVDFLDSVDEQNRPAVRVALQALQSGASHMDVSYRAVRKDNAAVWLRLEGNVVSRGKDRLEVYCSFSNVTEINEIMADHLRQISEALKTAEQAGRDKSEFYARMSHDMRTPMNGVLGMTALSKEENNIDVLHHNIDMIESSGKYMLSLINDTLDMQRIETGNLTLMPQVLAAGAFLENIESMIRPTAAQKNIAFHVIGREQFDGDICIDGVRFKQIFMNLLSNAVKFTPDGGSVTVEIERTPGKAGKDHYRFAIRDTGVGMSEEFIKNRIFSPYVQECNAMTTQYAGSGLGLVITKSLVEAMGGSITVESVLGKGSIFTLQFEIERAEAEAADAEKQQSGSGENEKTEHLAGKRILLCEDHPMNAEITIRLLSRKGIEAEHAQNGALGVEKFTASQPGYYDAVLMDVRMPVMDGLSAAAAIRALPRDDAKTVPIIAMTANAYAEDIQNSLAAGMNAHLSKPVDPEQLYSALEEFLAAPRDTKLATILVVDDLPVNRAVLRENLKDLYDVVEAENGIDAIAVLQNRHVDLIVTDIVMPGMNGIELIRRVRAAEATRKIPIIANTQLGEPDQEERLMALGADEFVYKPSSPQVLRLRVHNLLAQ